MLGELKIYDMKEFELTPIYDAGKSFYGKAIIIQTQNKLQLKSYNTIVAEYSDGKVEVFGDYSTTTLRHIKEFLKQNGFNAETKKQILKDYMKR